MSETIILLTAVCATSLVMPGLLLNMREFSRQHRPERIELSNFEHPDRLRTDRAIGYVPGFTGA